MADTFQCLPHSIGFTWQNFGNECAAEVAYVIMGMADISGAREKGVKKA